MNQEGTASQSMPTDNARVAWSPWLWTVGVVLLSLLCSVVVTRNSSSFITMTVGWALAVWGPLALFLYFVSRLVYYKMVLPRVNPQLYTALLHAEDERKARETATIALTGAERHAADVVLRLESNRYRDGTLVPLAPSGIVQKAGETFYWVTPKVELLGEHHHAHYEGGYAGVSVRVLKGVYVHEGGSHGHRVETTTIDPDDIGTLCISNQRILYVGTKQSIEVPLTKLVGITPYVDGLRLDRANKKAVVLRTHSEKDAIVAQRVISGQIAGTPGRDAAAQKELSDIVSEAEGLYADGKITKAQLNDAKEKIAKWQALII